MRFLASEHDVRVTRVHLQLPAVSRCAATARSAAGRVRRRKVRSCCGCSRCAARPGAARRAAEMLWPDRLPADPVANLNVLVNRGRRAGASRRRSSPGRPATHWAPSAWTSPRSTRRCAGPSRFAAEVLAAASAALSSGASPGRGHLRRWPAPARAVAPSPGRGLELAASAALELGAPATATPPRATRSRPNRCASGVATLARRVAAGNPAPRAARAGRASGAGCRRARADLSRSCSAAAGAAAGQRGRPSRWPRRPPTRLRHAAVRRPRRRAGRAAHGDRTPGDRGGVRARGSGQVAAGREARRRDAAGDHARAFPGERASWGWPAPCCRALAADAGWRRAAGSGPGRAGLAASGARRLAVHGGRREQAGAVAAGGCGCWTGSPGGAPCRRRRPQGRPSSVALLASVLDRLPRLAVVLAQPHRRLDAPTVAGIAGSRRSPSSRWARCPRPAVDTVATTPPVLRCAPPRRPPFAIAEVCAAGHPRRDRPSRRGGAGRRARSGRHGGRPAPAQRLAAAPAQLLGLVGCWPGRHPRHAGRGAARPRGRAR